jgi:exodeoxyribonuclease V beta subunit
VTGHEPQEFKVSGELPTGMTLLQASAGTGKTFTIAALTTRYVAEGILPIDRLLVITFTRMATGELRERVRERLVRAFDGLVDILEGAGGHEDDELVQLLASGPTGEVRARRDRLGKAIADFDAATIETTHGFCLQVLYGLGTAGDIDREVTLVEDVRDLMEEVVDDLYLRKFAGRPNPLHFTRADAMEIADFVLHHPDAELVPPATPQQDTPSIRRRFADAVRQEMDDRKRLLKILTYDDVLARLQKTLVDPDRGPVACARLRERYDVVLVDEFQDTDRVQWDIMHRAFGSGGSTLVLIGDPKQAIYAFRGADVYTYLDAHRVVPSEWTLDVNWRSDQGLLEAYDALFADAQLGYAEITYRRIRAAEANHGSRLVGAPEPAPLRFRILHADDRLVPLTPQQRKPKKPETRSLIARDLAADVAGLLSARPEMIERRNDGSEVERVVLHPGHIAVLVRLNSQAVTVQEALRAAEIPAVIGAAGSVFATPSAQDWLRLLEALERPTSRDRASLAALTSFVGWTAEEVATGSEGEWEDLHWALHRWAALLRDQGVASLFETVSSARGVPGRVLGWPSGERFMTDLRHIAQLLHEAGVSEGLGPTAMATWLGRRIHDAERDGDNEERTRRLESDVDAVQVITIHRSKGLEFPIVYCPYAWDGYTKKPEVPVFHDPANANRRTIDVGHAGNAFARHQKFEKEEARGEDLRLLYVALTRARHQAVLWWAGTQESEHSPLSRLLFDRDAAGLVPPYGTVHTDAEVEGAAGALGARVSVERVGPPRPAKWEPDVTDVPALEAAPFDRSFDTDWGRASYSSITRDLHEQPAIGSEPEPALQLKADEEEVPSSRPAGSGSAEPSPPDPAYDGPLWLAPMPGGALVGTVVHSVFERTGFDAPDLVAEVRAALDREVAWRNVDLGDVDDVVSGLCAALESPLGPVADGIRLRDIARRDRVDELGFEIPLVGGDDPAARLRVAAMADLLEVHLPAGDPVAAYASHLRDPSLEGALRGYLTGSLDLVFRLPGDRFVLADYKTNRLGSTDETLTAWHYRPEALQAEMLAAHYPLQALLYSVALHRYLRWRLRDYEPARHLAGVLYLFVRGMSAVEPTAVDGQPCGVWSWRPPAPLVESLSDLFDTGAP